MWKVFNSRSEGFGGGEGALKKELGRQSLVDGERRPQHQWRSVLHHSGEAGLFFVSFAVFFILSLLIHRSSKYTNPFNDMPGISSLNMLKGQGHFHFEKGTRKLLRVKTRGSDSRPEMR